MKKMIHAINNEKKQGRIHGWFGRGGAKTARNSKMWRTYRPTDQPTDRHGKV